MKIRMILVLGIVLGAVALVGCGADERPREAAAAPAEGARTRPLTLENCGLDVTYDKTPQRVVTLNQTAAEIVIRLGAGDRIVGTGYETDPVPDEIADVYDRIPLLSGAGEYVPSEKLLEAQPDFVYSSFASFLTAAESGDRRELHELGVPTYLTALDCSVHQAVTGVSFDMLFQEYEDLGAILGVPSAAEKLIAEQRAVLEDALADGERIEGTPTVMWFYSTYDGTPWAAGPGGLPQYVTERLGAKNVFDDASTKWAEVSWDEVAARNPDVIVVADLARGKPGDTAREKIALLKRDPLTSKLDAVVEDRFIVVPGRYMDPSYGSVYVVPAVANGLIGFQR